jgi:hypothetical protein
VNDRRRISETEHEREQPADQCERNSDLEALARVGLRNLFTSKRRTSGPHDPGRDHGEGSEREESEDKLSQVNRHPNRSQPQDHDGGEDIEGVRARTEGRGLELRGEQEDGARAQ